MDIISGNYVTDNEKGIGRVYLLKGLGEGKYAKAAEVKNKEGKPVVGARVAGDDENYNSGQICIHPFAADWDADGDLDLIIGNFTGSFTLVLNEKQAPGHSFASQGTLLKDKNGKILHSGGLHSAPTLIDWDKDGDLDLVSSNANIGLCVAINSGSAKKPALEPFKTLIKSAAQQKGSKEKPQPTYGFRSWIADINGDGKLDALIGDNSTLETPKPGLTKEQVAKKQKSWEASLKKAEKALEPIHKEMEELHKAGKNLTDDPELMERYQKLSEPLSKIYRTRNEFIKTTITGHVWLYLAK